jgi:hypothetical protein
LAREYSRGALRCRTHFARDKEAMIADRLNKETAPMADDGGATGEMNF